MSDKHRFHVGNFVWYTARGERVPAIVSETYHLDGEARYEILTGSLSGGNVKEHEIEYRGVPKESDDQARAVLARRAAKTKETPKPKDPRQWSVHIPMIYHETGALSTRRITNSYHLVSPDGVEFMHKFLYPVSERAAHEIAALQLRCFIIEYEDLHGVSDAKP